MTLGSLTGVGEGSERVGEGRRGLEGRGRVGESHRGLEEGRGGLWRIRGGWRKVGSPRIHSKVLVPGEGRRGFHCFMYESSEVQRFKTIGELLLFCFFPEDRRRSCLFLTELRKRSSTLVFQVKGFFLPSR